MLTELKIKVNRENSQKSTGPKTPEGKARVAQNAFKYGHRSKHAVLLMENNQEFKELLTAFHAEWQPTTITEEDLVEQMVVSKWKLARYEAAESQACQQSALVHIAIKTRKDYRRVHHGPLKSYDLVCKKEADAERSIARFNQLIARVERAYFRALQFLLRLRDLRLKRQRQVGLPAPTEAPAAPQPAPKIRTAGASSSTPIHISVSAPALQPVPVRRR